MFSCEKKEVFWVLTKLYKGVLDVTFALSPLWGRLTSYQQYSFERSAMKTWVPLYPFTSEYMEKNNSGENCQNPCPQKLLAGSTWRIWPPEAHISGRTR